MTKTDKALYRDTDELRAILGQVLKGKKFRLDCGHHITFHQSLGNNLTIYNGKDLKIICSQCGY